MDLVFESPAWLWLALLAPVAAFVPSGARDRVQPVLRGLAVLFLAIALARPSVWRADEREHVVLVVDASASVAPADAARALDAAAGLVSNAPATRSTTIVRVDAALESATDATRGREAQSSETRSSETRSSEPRSSETGGRDVRRVDPDAGGSSISAALEDAVRAIPDGARGAVVLATDGEATDAHVGDALVSLARRGVPLHVVPLARAPRPPTPVALTCDRDLVPGADVSMSVDLAGDGGDANVRWIGPDGEFARRDRVRVDGVVRLDATFEVPARPFVEIDVAVDDAAGTRTLRRTFAVQPPRRVLALAGRVRGSGARLGELLGPGFTVDAPAAGDAPGTSVLANVAAYDLVVLDDVPASALSDDEQRVLATRIESAGTGLLVAGGESAFGPGGWADAPLARLFPVECVQKEEKRDPSTTLALIIDTSGSMGGERIQLAKEVARLAMSRLLPHDKVGIVEFYGAKRWAAPIQPASNSIELQRALNRMDAGGGTIILPAIEEAYYGLQNVETRYKHVLVLTDGGVENGAFEPLLRRMAEEGMTVSTVLIGPEAHSEFLVNIANWGKGRFYSAPDRFNLPEILLKQPTSSRLPAYKPGTFATIARGGPAWWGRVSPADVPPVAGYVETTARPGAQTLLEIADERDPLLATWCAGVGRVTAFTTEPTGPGTQTWSAWRDYGRFLARVAARTADEDRVGFAFALARRGTSVEITATRTLAEELDAERAPRAHRVSTDGSRGERIAFERRGPATWVARLRVPVDEALRVEGSSDAPGASFVRCVLDARADVAAETQVDPRSALDLAGLASSTGGDVVRLDAFATLAPRTGGADRPERLVALAPFLVAAALATWLFEIFHRRRDRRAAE